MASRKRKSPGRSAKSFYKAMPTGSDVMFLAPHVMAMRMPALFWEMATPHFSHKRDRSESMTAVIEKSAAILEGYGHAHAELLQTWASIWIGGINGQVPDAGKMARAAQKVIDAGMEPTARRVRANYRRLASQS